MTSPAYQLFEHAMRARKRIVCVYGGHRRELCPIILGHTRGEERALAFQVGGESSSGLPLDGEWRCLSLARVESPSVQDGPWRAGESHTYPQGCVEEVDLDVNPDSPYGPKRD